jgi:uncharacterized metal-binding protein
LKKTGQCALCKVKEKICRTKDGTTPDFCSTKLYQDAIAKAAKEYEKADIKKFAHEASVQEATGYIDRDAKPYYRYPIKPRIQELIEFCRRMGYSKLGLAFCGGLHQEGHVLAEILTIHGFEVVSAMCKVGGVDKCEIGVREDEKIVRNSFESMCNPIAQAEIMNSANTEFNILLGLCIGHDSLFLKYSQALTTVFAVKDRVMGHNPLGAIYTYETYYQRFKADRVKEVDIKD